MVDYYVCILSTENQSLKESKQSGVSVNEIADHNFLNELKVFHGNDCQMTIKAWTTSSDSIPIRNASESLVTFLSNDFVKNQFYFVFAEEELDKNDNNNVRNERKQSFHGLETDFVRREDSLSSAENISVFGSPLKLESIADISLNDTGSDFMSTTNISDQYCSQLKGLPIKDARKILSRFCQIKRIEQKDSVLCNLAVLCDGMDLKKTLLLGAYHNIGSIQKLTTFRVTCRSKKTSLSFLVPHRLSDGSVSQGDERRSFGLLKRRDQCRRLRLEAKWADNPGNSIISNLHTARFALHIALPFGHKESPLNGYFSQLKHVMMLCKGLKEGGPPSVLSTKSYNALENLKNVFSSNRNGMHKDESPVVGREKKIILRPCNSSDITDQLWEVFSQCETYDDLVMCLKTTFNILKKNEFPLFVRQNNDTMFARLVRQSSNGLIYFPPLTSLMPLKIVAELGLEKMKNIYTSILLENALCSPNDLERFLTDCQREEMNLSVSAVEQDYQINETILVTVQKLHHCLDLLLLIDLHSENLSLKDAANHILNHYRQNDLDESFTFVIPLDTKQASKEIERVPPSSVRREYKMKGKTCVDCFLSEIPEGLIVNSDAGDNISTNCSESRDISTNFGDSREYFQFMTEEETVILG